MLLPYYRKDTIEAGCDEAGRGCLAGPVFAAAVILPSTFHHPLLNDSKQVSEADRQTLRPIIEQEAIAWAVIQVDPPEIDTLNILWASVAGMHRAVDQLSTKPELLLIDGNRFKPYLGISHVCVVKGDSKYASIAAASILAKTHRDDYMHQLAEQFPHYGWQTNVGYPTKAHREAIKVHGSCEHHRKSFKLV